VDDEGFKIPPPMAISRTIRACVGEGSEREELDKVRRLLWWIACSCCCCLSSGLKGVRLVELMTTFYGNRDKKSKLGLPMKVLVCETPAFHEDGSMEFNAARSVLMV